LTAKYAYSVNLLAYWKVGEKEPWLFVTNPTFAKIAMISYQRLMLIEETFGDLKGNG